MGLRDDSMLGVAPEAGLREHAERIHQVPHLGEVVTRVQVGDAARRDRILGEDILDDTREVDRHDHLALKPSLHDVVAEQVPVLLELLELFAEHLLDLDVGHDALRHLIAD